MLSLYLKKELSFVGDCSASFASRAKSSALIVTPHDGFACGHTSGSFQSASCSISWMQEKNVGSYRQFAATAFAYWYCS